MGRQSQNIQKNGLKDNFQILNLQYLLSKLLEGFGVKTAFS